MENFKICGFFVLVLLLKVFGLSDAKEVQCESIRTYSWVGPVGAVKTCLMNKTTSIDGPGVTILPRDETIKGLSFGYLSYKISHLPENVAESFPNLEIYEANTCAVTEITKQNFNGLVKLKVLFLAGNRIETIADDTFESLVALELINLSELNSVSVLATSKFCHYSWQQNQVHERRGFQKSQQIVGNSIEEKCLHR